MKFNPSQQKAIESDSMRILCLAGAGSGKTRTLTARISRLIDSRIGSSNILALTFTRLAGKEVKERVIEQVGKPLAKNLFSNTFHAFSIKVINETNPEYKGFDIYDQDDKQEIISNIIMEYGINATVKKCLNEWEDPQEKDVVFIKSEYKARLRENNALDLDLILEKCLECLQQPETAEKYRIEYPYVFVDEFQDTNRIQMDILLALNPQNLFCVGDIDQSIYQWRGAIPEYALDFGNYFGEHETIKLEENYRSTRQIVEVANQIIRNNVNRVDKKLIAQRDGEKVEYEQYPTPQEEKESIVEILASHYKDSYSDFAILSRTNAYLEEVATAFRKYDIPYEIVSNQGDILKMVGVKGILNILALINNPANDFVARKVFSEHIQVKELGEIEMFAKINGESLYNCIDHPIKKSFEKIKEKLPFESPRASYREILTNFNIIQDLKEKGLNNRVSEHLQALERLEEWEQVQERLGEDKNLEAFLKYLAIKDIQEKLIKTKDRVKLLTVHASKGLEWKVVFLVGMNQGTFPSRRSENQEEERNLAYVAITRAKDFLYISSTKETTNPWNGNVESQEPSKYLKEGGLIYG